MIFTGGAIALANKKPITGDLALYQKLTANPKRFRAESTCGAGMPVNNNNNRQAFAGRTESFYTSKSLTVVGTH
jgi:homoserine dehydrogenase